MRTVESRKRGEWGRNQSLYSPTMSMFNLYNGISGQGSISSGGGNDGESIVVSELSDGVSNDAAEVRWEGKEMENREKKKKKDDTTQAGGVPVKVDT